ncbi:hypothetical protein PIROE2DRAFT_64564 [Piromyces sp. E2]|nr:hypothetical protein PIROE2DRAFT_64564 [Piromyces sp. E2]|eukprot:OUM58231.1 hypothetical protein PIROE2DRAFT_64564 [Piromyces sp. E2]
MVEVEVPSTNKVSNVDDNNNKMNETILTENNESDLQEKSLSDNKGSKLRKSISFDGNESEFKIGLSIKKLGMTKDLPKETRNSLSMSKYFKSTGNINFNDPLLKKRSNLKSEQNMLKSTLGKSQDFPRYQSIQNIRSQVGLKHYSSSMYFPSVEIEGNTREYDVSIRRLRKTFTSPHIYESSESLYSDLGSSESLMSSTMTLGSHYSICDSCDSICESILDLLAKKDSKRFTEMENGHLKLITYKQCPSWLTDNPYIISNYRPPCYSYKACYKSLFYLHNETEKK